MMSLVFNHHRRFSKRLYNGLKRITDENGVLLEKSSQRSEERTSGTPKKSLEEVAGGCGLEVIDSEDDTSIDDIDDGEEDHQEEGGYSHCLMDTKSSDFSPRPQVDEVDFTNEKNSGMNKSHVSSRIPTTGLKKYPQKRCVVCRKHGTPCDTRHYCPACNVALCKGPCFNEYHSS